MIEKLKEILAWLRSSADTSLQEENARLKLEIKGLQEEIAKAEIVVDDIYDYIE